MRYFLYLLIFFLAIFLQISFFSAFSLFGGTVDILLILLIYFSWRRGMLSGLFWGLGFGLAADIVLGIFPFCTISKMAVGGIIGRYQRSFSGSPLYVFTLLITLSSIAVVLIEAILYYFYYGEIFPFFINILTFSLILNVLFSFLLFPLLRRIPQGREIEDDQF